MGNRLTPTHGEPIKRSMEDWGRLPDLQLLALCSIENSYPVTNSDWRCRNASINCLAQVCKGWWQCVAPAGKTDCRLDRRVKITASLEAADMRLWWTVVKTNYSVTDATISALVAGCPALTNINVSGCNNVTDASFATLAAGCPGITDVTVVHCNNITDDSLVAPAAGCPGLTNVSVNCRDNLSGCRNLTDVSIAALAAGCPELTNVDMANCRNMTDASIIALAAGCPRLINVDMANCRSMTDASIIALAAGCPRLTVVDVVDCNLFMVRKHIHVPNMTDILRYP